jgi:transmembrane sensor
MNVSKFRTWCLLSLQNELSPAQEAKFKDWIEKHPKRLKQFEALKTVWDRTVPEPPDDVDIEAQWKRLDARLNREPAGACDAPVRHEKAVRFVERRTEWIPALGLAVAVILIIILLRHPGSVRSSTLIVSTSDGIRELVLSDGSRVYLNHASEIQAEQPFSDTLRIVKMQGEVYFDVEHNAAPFEVVTDQATVRVTGTRFNVWARESRTRVLVSSGTIHFTDSNRAGTVRMKPGEMSEVIAHSPPTPVRNIPIESLNAGPGWLHGLLEFYRMPLTDIAAELSRTFSTPIHVADPALGACSVTATYSDESLDTILESLALTLHMKIIQDEKGIVLEGVEQQ